MRLIYMSKPAVLYNYQVFRTICCNVASIMYCDLQRLTDIFRRNTATMLPIHTFKPDEFISVSKLCAHKKLICTARATPYISTIVIPPNFEYLYVLPLSVYQEYAENLNSYKTSHLKPFQTLSTYITSTSEPRRVSPADLIFSVICMVFHVKTRL